MEADRAGARRSIWSSSRSPAPRRPTAASASTLALLDEGARGRASRCGAARSATTSCISKPARAARCPPTPITASISRRCEARAYAVARHFKPLLVNTVVGFIGPEYLYDGKQIIRAGLGRSLLRQAAGPADGLRRLLHQPRRSRSGRHGRAADPARRGRRATTSWAFPAPTTSCCNYQSTSFHDALALRELFGLRPAPEFEDWLARAGLFDAAGRVRPEALPARLRALLPG